MSRRAPSPASAHLVALLAVAVAISVRIPVYPLIGARRPYLTLYGAVALAVWYGRWRPGTLAALLGFLAANYFIVDPADPVGLDTLFIADTLGYALSAGLIVILGEAMHRAVDRSEQAARELATSVEAERRQTEILRVTLTSLGDAVIATDADGRVTFLNPVAEQITGWSPKDAAGQPLETVFHIVNEQTRSPVENPAARALREGLVVGLANHTVLIGKDGTETLIDDSAAPIKDPEGQVLGCVLVFRDITARRRAEQRSADHAGRIASIVNHVLDGIIAIDEVGTIEAFNPAAERLFGYPAKEVIGRNVKLLMPEPYHGEHDGYLEQYRHSGRAKIIGIGREVIGRRRDGTTFPMDLAVSEFMLGNRRYFTGIVRDITERKQTEKQRQDLLAALEEADRRKDRFLATLAHELRNPLAPIRNAVQVLQAKGPPDPELRWCRDVIARQVYHMTRLLEDLFDVSRITHNKLELRKERIELSMVLRNAVETSRPHFASAGRELAVSLGPEPIFLNADAVRLAQVFVNLLNNAVKYTGIGGHVELLCQRQGSDAVVTVSDDGVGIAADMLPRVFDPFTQVQRVLDHPPEGIGIGLSLVRGLVYLHGGTVEVSSEGLGKGSAFMVRLPVLVEHIAQKAVPLPAEAPHQPLPRRRILIADDLQDSADSLALLLKTQGHEVKAVYDGEAAFRAAHEFLPEIALLDIGMPKHNGYDTCKHIRQQSWSEGMLIVALTGWGQEGDRQRAQAAGFDHHMVKPVDPEELTTILATLSVPKPGRASGGAG